MSKLLKHHILFLVFTFIATLSHASEKKILLIAVSTVDFPPFEYFENDQLIGIHIEMITQVAKLKGYEVDFIRLPRERILSRMKAGTIDGVTMVGLMDNEYDLSWFHGGNAMSVSAARLLVRKDSKIKYKGKKSDLEGLTIAVLRGFSYGDGFFEDIKFTPFPVDSLGQLKTLVRLGRVDASIVTQAEWFEYRKNGSDTFKILSRPMSNMWSYMGFSKAKFGEYFSYEFSKEMSNFLNTSEYAQIINKYIGKNRK
jgi:polar amino acid transport system substrate-binding protein